MRIDELIDIKNIDTSIEPMTKDQVIDRMISKLSQNGYVQDADVFRKAIYQRENEISTAVGYGVAIPHARTRAVERSTIAVFRDLAGVQWGQEKVNLVFMIAAEESASDEHLKMLSKI